MQGVTQYLNRTDARIYSPGIWGNFPWATHKVDACLFEDDFVEHPVTTAITTEAVAWGPYKAYCSTSGAITFATTTGGAVVLSETTDNEGAALKVNALPFNITRGYGDLWFESRLKIKGAATLVTTDMGLFVGLGDAMTLGATVPLTATSTLADENLVGFLCDEADWAAGVGTLDAVYKANGVTAVTVQAGTANFTEDTYTNVGFHYNDTTHYLHYFIDNAEVGSVLVIATAGTDFPNDVQMSPVIAIVSGASAPDVDVTMDWWACAQLISG